MPEEDDDENEDEVQGITKAHNQVVEEASEDDQIENEDQMLDIAE